MSLKRTLAAQLPRSLGAAAAGALLLGVVGGFGCSTYPTFKEFSADCQADQGYEFWYLSSLNSTLTDDPPSPSGKWWGAGDYLPDGGTTRAVSTIETMTDGARCGSQTADVLRVSGYTDWGSLFGYNYLLPTKPATDGYFEGLSFWARAPGATTKGFTVILGDPNTEVGLNNYCKSYGSSAGNNSDQGGGANMATGTTAAASNVTRAPYPDECGNEYQVSVQVTSDWVFYPIPFATFQQSSKPNRVPNAVLTEVGNVPGTGLLTDQILLLLIRMSREARMELWLDNVAYYRKKG
jgi:hypothetical protein